MRVVVELLIIISIISVHHVTQAHTAHNLVNIINTDTSLVVEDHIHVKDFPVLQVWDILAPFPIGPREQGADPLNAYGGITNIPRGGSATYPSELVNGGKVGWTRVTTTQPNGAVPINFNSSFVNWQLIEDWAGSAGAYFQGWALSDFSLDSAQAVMVTCTGAGTIYVDTRLLNGDKYGANFARTSIYLLSGKHTIRVLFTGSEATQFTCSLAPVDIINTSMQGNNDILAPDFVNGKLASPYVSITVVNLIPENLVTVGVAVVNTSNPNVSVKVTSQSYPTLAPSQTLPISFQISASELESCFTTPLVVVFALAAKSGPDFTYYQSVTFNCRNFTDAFVFTFPDADNSTQYAAARAPANPCPNKGGCPVLLTLHGAGVEAGSNAWTYAYYQQNYSWLLFPTNRRNYGWDWQGPGLQNALSTLDFFVNNLPGVPNELRNTYSANGNLIIYAGHSMGGHGCWTISTHYPDRALAVVPAAGWISMELYQPFFLRVGNSWTDPFVHMLLGAAIADYNDDYYTPHLAGIPLLIRMGSADDNVPPYHLRRMARLVDELTANPQYTEISEIPGQGHWFNGVVDDAVIQEFLNTHVTESTTTHPPLPTDFTVVTVNPATSEGRGGLQILQLTIPYRAGKITVHKGAGGVWTLKTENIRRFAYAPLPDMEVAKNFIVDTQPLAVQFIHSSSYLLENKSWTIYSGNAWLHTERGPLSYGPLEQVLRRPLIIAYGTQDNLMDVRFALAIFVANSLYYQARYAITILADRSVTQEMINDNNVIIIGGPSSNLVAKSVSSQFPSTVKFEGKTFAVDGQRFFDQPTTGITFLTKCGTSVGGLCAVLEGTDEAGLRKAVQLLPLVSSVTVPDYAVAGPKWGQSGSSGLLALGFWDNNWSYNSLCGYVTSL